MKGFWIAYALWLPIWVLVGILVVVGIKFEMRIKMLETQSLWLPYPPKQQR